MKITMVIANMSFAGPQRVMSILVNYWAMKQWDITLLTLDDGSTPSFYELEKTVQHIPLGVEGASANLLVGLGNNLRRVDVLRRAIRNSQPDVAIAFVDQMNVVTLLATRGLNVPVVVSEHADPAVTPLGRVWQHLRQWTYPQADRMVVLTQTARNYFSPELQSRIAVIPNPVLPPDIEKSTLTQQLVKPAIIAMGRFSEEKRFDLLLQAFGQLKDRYPQWTLIILGEGELRAELERLRDRLKLTDRVYFPGRVKNPYEFLQQADLFVLSSRYEAFPMALCEAMACGLPVISTNCPSGAREIIRDGVDGILVSNEDIDALSTAMDKLMSDEKERQRLAARAPEVTQRFSLEKVMGMWEAVLREAIAEKQ